MAPIAFRGWRRRRRPHQSRDTAWIRGARARKSVSFSGKRNVSKTHNINSIRLFRARVRKAQRRHCVNASAVTSPAAAASRRNKWPRFLPRTERARGSRPGGAGGKTDGERVSRTTYERARDSRRARDK